MANSIVVDIRGDKALIRAFDQLRISAQRRIVRSAVRKALTPINKAAKKNANAVKDTGLLAKSIGAKMVDPKKLKPGEVVGIVGPRPGFRRVIEGRPRNPIKYAHLVEFGTEPHKIRARRGGVLRIGGRFVRSVDHPGSFAKPFLRPAFDSQVGNAKRAMVAEVQAGLIREAKRARARSGRR